MSNVTDPERLREAVAGAWKCWNNQRPVDAITVSKLIEGTEAYLRILEADDQLVEELGELLWRMSRSGDPGEDCRPQARAVLARLGGNDD